MKGFNSVGESKFKLSKNSKLSKFSGELKKKISKMSSNSKKKN